LELNIPLAVHIGIAMGEVVASSVGSQRHRGYTVTGEAANIAARLLAAAASGETIVSEAVYFAAGRASAYEPLGALALKGFERPIQAWRLIATKSEDAGVQAFVGRESELSQCRAALNACSAGASGAAILIRGEPGIGKTRLVEELQSM